MLQTALLLTLLTAPPAPAPKPSLAIMDLVIQDVAAERASSIQDAVSSEIRSSNVYGRVVTSHELGALLKPEAGKTDCGDASCLKDIANALGVDHVVIGTLTHVEETTTLSLFVLDMHKAVTQKSVQRKLLDAGTDDVKLAARELLGIKPPPPPAPIAVKPAVQPVVKAAAEPPDPRRNYWTLAAVGLLSIPAMWGVAIMLGGVAYLITGGIAYFAMNTRPGLQADEAGWVMGGIVGGLWALLGVAVGATLATLGGYMALRS